MGKAKLFNLLTHTRRKRKRVRRSHASSSKHELCDKEKKHLDKEKCDRISKLPDEVLVSILSLLSITEAATTSVLSHRWERLWTFYTGSLNFDFTPRLYNLEGELRQQERSKYIAQVNQVLASLVGSSTLYEFTLQIDSDKPSMSQIDKWVEFALEKRVQRLELDMKPFGFLVSYDYFPYTFPSECYARIKQQPISLYRISALTSLCLKYINLPGDFVDYFLSSCPLLERLCLVGVDQLLNLKVAGAAALKLKHLEISKCHQLEYVEIVAAPNLLSLIYFGQTIKLHLENVPQLVEVSIGSDVITFMSRLLSSYLSQLETLKLDFCLEMHEEFTQSLKLSRIKHLILSVGISHDKESLLGWTSLIEASPFLQKFTLEVLCFFEPDYRRGMQTVTATYPHKCLKVVEFVGFVGSKVDTELAMYFLSNSSTLEKVIIDLRPPQLLGTPRAAKVAQEKKAAKKRGQQLKRYLPSGVDFVLI